LRELSAALIFDDRVGHNVSGGFDLQSTICSNQHAARSMQRINHATCNMQKIVRHSPLNLHARLMLHIASCMLL
jgi:hypothetical protein